MASIVDAFNDSLSENKAFIKIFVYAIPVYYMANLFLVGKMQEFYFCAYIVGVLLLALLTQGINNVRKNKNEVLTLNPVQLGKVICKMLLSVVPQCVIFGILANHIISTVKLPDNLPHGTLIFQIIVLAIIGSIILTSYLSFSKYLKVSEAYNYKVIFESCIDVLISFIFFIPQLILANIVLIGPVAYLFSIFQVSYMNWAFVAYSSAVFVINISILANYFAQTAYEQIKGNNEDYEDNMQINVVDEAAERLNGR